jgi:hypothetical protein
MTYLNQRIMFPAPYAAEDWKALLTAFKAYQYYMYPSFTYHYNLKVGFRTPKYYVHIGRDKVVCVTYEPVPPVDTSILVSSVSCFLENIGLWELHFDS